MRSRRFMFVLGCVFLAAGLITFLTGGALGAWLATAITGTAFVIWGARGFR